MTIFLRWAVILSELCKLWPGSSRSLTSKYHGSFYSPAGHRPGSNRNSPTCKRKGNRSGDPETSHVIPAIFRKCIEAVRENREEVVRGRLDVGFQAAPMVRCHGVCCAGSAPG